MRCDQAMERLADALPGGPGRELGEHLAGCTACRAEAESLRQVWEDLGRLPEEAPGEGLSRRFGTMLEAARAAADTEVRSAGLALSRPAARARWLEALWPRRPVARFAYTLGVLAVGVSIGLSAGGAGRDPGVGELRQEVRSLSNLVALSLLKQESASERLKGVSYGRLAGEGDDQVMTALLDAVSTDPNVNVRLAAIDALGTAARQAAVRERLLETFPRQESPLVQIALTDLLLAAGDQGARQALDGLANNPSLDPTVRDYLRRRLEPRT